MRMRPWHALALTWVVSALVNQLAVQANAFGVLVLIVLGGAWLGYAFAAVEAPPPDRNDDPRSSA